jgi:hypothetical protein
LILGCRTLAAAEGAGSDARPSTNPNADTLFTFAIHIHIRIRNVMFAAC